MKYAVIDVGSNSVRLMVSEELKTLYKKINTTRLASGLSLTGRLAIDRMLATADAIEEFAAEAKANNCDGILVFATEAVRSAANKYEFVKLLADRGIHLNVVASEDEARLGFEGAYTDGICCVLDIGGASTELAVGDGNGLKYAKSLPIGLVRIYDNCKEDLSAIDRYVASVISGYGELPKFDNLLAIGGTASTFVAIKEELRVYDPKVVDGYVLTRPTVDQLTAKLHAMSVEERCLLAGLEPKRADVIVGGGRLLSAIMGMLGRDSIIVRESDNQEGYLSVWLSKKISTKLKRSLRKSLKSSV